MSKISEFSLISLIFVSCIYIASSDQDPYILNCKKNDPQFSQCFRSEIQRGIPYLKNGNPKFNLPSYDPFELPNLSCAKGTGFIPINLNLTKTKIYGLTSAQFSELQVDPNELTGHAKLGYNESIKLIGSYSIAGKINKININSKGNYTVTFVDLNVELYNVTGVIRWKNGVKYMDLKDMNLKVTNLKNMLMQFDNLVKDDPVKSQYMNALLNENWNTIFEELQPAYEEHIRNILHEIARRVLNKIPVDSVLHD